MKTNSPRLPDIQEPLAIAMWDFSWLLRHHRLGEFEDWDRVLDELVERGYNAIRIEAFPHLVAANEHGVVQDSFRIEKERLGIVLWGTPFSTTICPREALLEFLPKCEKRGIYVGLSSWLTNYCGRGPDVAGVDGMVRIWKETLDFLDANGLLNNVIYVDLLNEYPLWHGYQWLKNQLAGLSDRTDTVVGAATKVHEQQILEGLITERQFNERQVRFYNQFIDQIIDELRQFYSDMPYFASVPKAFDTPWEDIDLTRFGALDMHVWLVHNREFSLYTNYFQDIHPFGSDRAFAGCSERIETYWRQNKDALVDWMDREIESVARRAREFNIPAGNTEGWGAISWMDHPDLSWDFIKETAEVCVELSVKHGYRFICTSNFTHPQFPGLWNDIEWHRRLTGIIRA